MGTQSKRDRAAALDAAMHAYAIKRAREVSPNEAERQALIRLGPVPATCQACRANPPITFVMDGPGYWLCAMCAR